MNYITCPVCGRKNKAIFKYCKVCLARLYEPSHYQIPTYEIRKGMLINRWLFVALVFIIFILLSHFGLIKLPLIK